jgi:hypothetical protein
LITNIYIVSNLLKFTLAAKELLEIVECDADMWWLRDFINCLFRIEISFTNRADRILNLDFDFILLS